MKKVYCLALAVIFMFFSFSNRFQTYSEPETQKLRIGYVESERLDNFSRNL